MLKIAVLHENYGYRRERRNIIKVTRAKGLMTYIFQVKFNVGTDPSSFTYIRRVAAVTAA